MSNKIWRSHSDWVIAIGAFLLVLIIGIGIVIYNHIETSSVAVSLPRHKYDPYSGELYKIIPPDPAYPAPAKEQRGFYRTYTEKDIQYSIEKIEVNTSRDPSIGANSFRVNMYNSSNKVIAPTDDYLKAISIGCIAQDEPYRALEVAVTPLSLEPYEVKSITVDTDARCRYLGTTDGGYFWRVY